MRPILCYTSSESANSAIRSLNSSGIEANLTQHSSDEEGVLFSVSVPVQEEQKAVDTVAQNDLESTAIRCPACNDINVEYPAAPQASPTMKVAEMVVDALAGNKHDFICRKCSHSWS